MARQSIPDSPRRVQRIPKARRIDVRREEYNRLIDTLNERGTLLNRVAQAQAEIQREQHLQLQRIAQIQAELDMLKREVARLRD
jgi:hypothetical protein